MMGCVIFGVETMSSAGVATGLALILSGIAAGALLVRREWGDPAPLFPVDLLKIRIFAMSIATSTVSFAAQMLAFVTLPFLFQYAFGRSAFETGLLMTPWPLALGVVAPLAGRLADRARAGLVGGVGLADLRDGPVCAFASRAVAGDFGYRVADGAVRNRLRPVPVAQQPHDHQLRSAPALRAPLAECWRPRDCSARPRGRWRSASPSISSASARLPSCSRPPPSRR